jgi:hypothetical protein
VVPIGLNTGASCLLLAGHLGDCEPCVGVALADLDVGESASPGSCSGVSR